MSRVTGENWTAEQCAGLPAADRWYPIPPDSDARFREGLVVSFSCVEGEDWIANFHVGRSGLTTLAGPAGRYAVVVAGGVGYMVRPDTRSVIDVRTSPIRALVKAPRDRWILASDTRIECLDGDGSGWLSPRVSWDGIEGLSVVRDHIEGRGWYAPGRCFLPFSLDLDAGILREDQTAPELAELARRSR